MPCRTLAEVDPNKTGGWTMNKDKIEKWLKLGERIASSLILEKSFSVGNQTPIFRIYEDEADQKVRNELASGRGLAAHHYGELFVAVPEMLNVLRRATVQNDIQNEVAHWADEAFPESNDDTILSHFREEVGEFLDNPSPEEAADVVMILMHYAQRHGWNLLDECARKLEVNKARTWSKRPTDAGHYTHVEEPMRELTTIDKDTLQTLVEAACECLHHHVAAYGDHPTDRRCQDEMRTAIEKAKAVLNP
ncbi:MAG: DUF550 domain-containing protein [Calditrichaeota bacterium]|nr:MAG: DUF550 domain-containing protein [Calditrichota bacterium]